PALWAVITPSPRSRSRTKATPWSGTHRAAWPGMFARRIAPIFAVLALCSGCREQPDATRSQSAAPAAAIVPIAQVQPSPDEQPPKRPDVIYVPTPQPVVDKMLELAEVQPGDVVYDLGCGDGRIV